MTEDLRVGNPAFWVNVIEDYGEMIAVTLRENFGKKLAVESSFEVGDEFKDWRSVQRWRFLSPP